MKIIVMLIFVHLLKLKIASAIDIDDVLFGESVVQDIREFMEIQKHTQQEEILVEHVARHLKTLHSRLFHFARTSKIWKSYSLEPFICT